MHPSVRNRLGNRPRFEYVNRAGQQVNSRTGNPYKRPPNNPSGRLTRQPEVTNKTPKTLPVRTTGAMFGGLEPIPTDPTIDPPPWACFNCWQKGHSRRNCPMPCTALLCHNCGRRGEQVSTCPRCWRVHREYVIKLSELRAKGKIYSDVEELLASVDGNDACDEVLRELILQNEMNKRPTQSMDRRNPTHHERHTGLTFFQEFENSTHNRFNNSQFHEQELEETELEDDSYAVEDRLLSRESIDQSNGQESPEWRKYDRTSREEEPSQSSSIDVGDPVQDILSLAKSISHLSADTQDLIMRQVMAERKELARLRALREEHIKVKEDHW